MSNAVSRGPVGFVRTAPEWQPRVLRCRFVIEANPTPARLSQARYEASNRFVDDMVKQGWTLRGTIIGNADPCPPSAPLDSGVKKLAPLAEQESWEYEIAGLFVKPLMPTEILAKAPRLASREELTGVRHSHAHRPGRGS